MKGRYEIMTTKEFIEKLNQGAEGNNAELIEKIQEVGKNPEAVYAIAKEGVIALTKWLAQEMAIKYSEKIRVNAIAPGFFIGEQNRRALINEDGSLTERSHKVLAKTPMRRFGDISELNGIVKFLCSDEASFVTGTVIPIDGGFSSFSGV